MTKLNMKPHIKRVWVCCFLRVRPPSSGTARSDMSPGRSILAVGLAPSFPRTLSYSPHMAGFLLRLNFPVSAPRGTGIIAPPSLSSMPFPGRGTPRPGLPLFPPKWCLWVTPAPPGPPSLSPPPGQGSALQSHGLPLPLLVDFRPWFLSPTAPGRPWLLLFPSPEQRCPGQSCSPIHCPPCPRIAPQPPEARDWPAEGSTPPAYPAATSIPSSHPAGLGGEAARALGSQTAWVTATQPPPASSSDEDLT